MNRRPASADYSRCIAERFGAAAESYDAHSHIQRLAAARLAGLITTAGLPPRPRVLEIGCGTGHLTTLLGAQLPGARILATDIAPAMVAACKQRHPGLEFAVMDGARPTVTGGFDLICANLAVQWFPDLPATLETLVGLLAPEGLLAFSLLGADTFREWRTAHAHLGLRPGTLDFPTANSFRAAFPLAGDWRLIKERHLDRPANPLAFLRGLREIGADTAAPGHVPLSPRRLRQVMRALGDAPTMTYELLYASGRRSR